MSTLPIIYPSARGFGGNRWIERDEEDFLDAEHVQSGGSFGLVSANNDQARRKRAMTKQIAVITVLSIFMFVLEGSAAAQRHGHHVKRSPQQFYYKPPYYPRGNGYGY